MANKALWGWYPAGNAWVKLQVAATGKLVVDPTALFENPPTNGETEKAPQSDWAYDHWKDPIAHQDTGGKCGLTVTALGGAITLTPRTDTIYQVLDPNGANRTVSLATVGAVAGDRFYIKNSAVFTSLLSLAVYQGMTNIETIYSQGKKGFIFDGTNWIGIDVATGEAAATSRNLALGFGARAENNGMAIGPLARADVNGMALGPIAQGYSGGVGIGEYADGHNFGVSIGRNSKTNGLAYSIALGAYSEATRPSEMAINISQYAGVYGKVTQGRYYKQTTNNVPIEMMLGGYGTQRFTIKASSFLAFRITAGARDNVAGDVAMYTFEGLIKRDAANNTVMSVCNKIVVHEDDAAWDCDVTADDANEALIITVTGDDTNPTRWAAVLEGVETYF